MISGGDHERETSDIRGIALAAGGHCGRPHYGSKAQVCIDADLKGWGWAYPPCVYTDDPTHDCPRDGGCLRSGCAYRLLPLIQAAALGRRRRGVRGRRRARHRTGRRTLPRRERHATDLRRHVRKRRAVQALSAIEHRQGGIAPRREPECQPGDPIKHEEGR